MSDQIMELPPHNYGVIVEDQKDARSLLWLVNAIGEKKLIASVEKYNKQYPGYDPFVSTLLKQNGLKVPVSVFAVVNVPIYYVYIVYHIESSKIKIGYSGNWLSHISNLSRFGSINMFDLKRSVAFNFYGNKQLAIKAASMAKKRFFSATASMPERMPYEGQTKWFLAYIYDDVFRFIRDFDTLKERNFITLETALAFDIRVCSGNKKLLN